MSDTQNTTPEGSGELTVEGAANAFLSMMDREDGSDKEQPESASEANESDAESEESEVEQDDDGEEQEQPTYLVKAAGEEREVTLNELIKSYQLGTDYTKKSQAVAEERKAVESERQAVQEAKQMRDTYAQRLEMIEQMLQPQQEENLEYLKETDPIGYSVKVAEMVQRDKQLSAVQAERSRINQQQEQDRQAQMQSVVAEEMQKLTAFIPEFTDPAKGESIRNDIRAFAKQVGFSDNELAAVYDSRAVLTLYKAMQYDKLVASKPAITKKVNEAPKAIKSGVSKPRDSNAEETRKLKARAKSSGSIRDAASVFERFI
jgi:hypothetical protein